MRNFKNIGIALSRSQMRNVFAGDGPEDYGLSAAGECGSKLDCRYQSPALYTYCSDGTPSCCQERSCTTKYGTSTNFTFGCGTC